MASPTTETPFTISVSDTQLSILQQKLALTTLPDELPDSGWDYGVPLADIQRLVSYWKGKYDWRKHEADINREMPQFTRDIDVDGDFGKINVHYVHKRSEVDSAVPLLIVHGWPGSFFEVRKILPLLVKASLNHPSFHVVAISLPGFGFSAAPAKKGFGLSQYAEVAHKLMLALGYDEYAAQGGDWGHFITRKIATVYGPKHCKAWHTNFPLGAPPSLSRPLLLISHLLATLRIPGFAYNARDQAGLERTMLYFTKKNAYYKIQSTQPQTLGYSFADSPVGLLSWWYHMLVKASEDYPWSEDEVLTWVSLYYFSRAGPAASLRIYYEATKADGGIESNKDTPIVPAGHSYFPTEVIVMPRSWVKTRYLVFESEHESGGHFAAYEKPDELAGDLRKMFGKGGGAYGVIKANTGYDE